MERCRVFAWSPVGLNVELHKLVVLVSLDDNLTPDLTQTSILLRCFAAAGILPQSRTAYQGAYI